MRSDPLKHPGLNTGDANICLPTYEIPDYLNNTKILFASKRLGSYGSQTV